MTQGLTSGSIRLASGYEMHRSEIGTGAPIVFIHGSGPGASGSSNFRPNLGAFAAAGYRVIAPDLIGYGGSSKPSDVEYTLDFFVDTLVEELDRLEIERCTLVGNSLGGAIAIRIALDRPALVDKLIMMAPGGIETRETYFAMPGIQRMVGGFTSEGFDEARMRAIVTNLVYDPACVTDSLVAERFAVAKTQPKEVLSTMRVPDLSPRLGELTQPILGFWGLDDGFCPASGAAKFLTACQDVRFVTFNRCGHWVMVERAEEFNRYALGFLAA
jgi:4,5:9,10-diseco-3-hydroxy-5,9,17-trioxoandrosta-1(10),2-diene-4-oate hydrolase